MRAEPAATMSAAGKPHPSILLVDDDSFMLDLQSRMLRDMGYRDVRTARGIWIGGSSSRGRCRCRVRQADGS